MGFTEKRYDAGGIELREGGGAMVARSGKKQAGHNLARYRQYHVVGRKTPSEKEPEPPVYRMKVWAPDDVRAKAKFWFALAHALPSLLCLGCAEARAPNSPRQVLLAQAQESEENQRRDPQCQRGSLPSPLNPPIVSSSAFPAVPLIAHPLHAPACRSSRDDQPNRKTTPFGSGTWCAPSLCSAPFNASRPPLHYAWLVFVPLALVSVAKRDAQHVQGVQRCDSERRY